MVRKLVSTVVATVFLFGTPITLAAEREDNERDRNRDHREDLSWSYLKLSHLEYDMYIFGVDIEPDGYEVELALKLGDHLYGFIDRSRAEGDVFRSDYDFDSEGYGFGWHWDTWFASYSYNTWDLDNNEFDVDTIRFGFRNQWTERIEFNASYTWNNIEDADNDDGFQLGFAFELWDDFNLTSDYETIGGDLDIDTFKVGVRLDF